MKERRYSLIKVGVSIPKKVLPDPKHDFGRAMNWGDYWYVSNVFESRKSASDWIRKLRRIGRLERGKSPDSRGYKWFRRREYFKPNLTGQSHVCLIETLFPDSPKIY